MSALQPSPVSKRFLGPRLRLILAFVMTVASSVLVVLALKAWVMSPYRIPTPSMEPTLHCKRDPPRENDCLGNQADRVLANRFIYTFEQPRRGQIVVFTPPPQATIECGERGAFVKRLVGLPGEELHEDSRGFIWVRHRPRSGWVKLAELYLSRQDRRADSADFGRTWYVPKDGYFMIGDNRAKSCDSRRWGAVPRRDLIGPVVATYWPVSRISIAIPGLVGSLILAAFAAILGSLALFLGAVARSRLHRWHRARPRQLSRGG